MQSFDWLVNIEFTLSGLYSLLIAFAERCRERIFVELPGWVLEGGHRFYWVYLLSFVLLGTLAYRRYYRAPSSPPAGPLADWARFLFPPEVYRHRSAVLDYQLLLTNRLLGPGAFLSSLLLGSLSIAWVADATQRALAPLAGGQQVAMSWSFATSIVFVIGMTMVRDFATFASHALHHRIPLLWEFHKVHHSAEVLTPFTVYRKHPVYTAFSTGVDLAIVGPVQGVVTFLFVGHADPITLFGANVLYSIFHLCGSNLRHSHIWLSFGPYLSRVFISPAQHQIHHSTAERHWNKNYGEVFALWDWLFGTLYVPGREREVLQFGIPGGESQEHPTLLRAYFVPFRNCVRLLRGYVGGRSVGESEVRGARAEHPPIGIDTRQV